MRVPVSPHPGQYLISGCFICLFVCLFIGSSHSDGFEVLSQCGSDLHFLNISATVNISDVGHLFCVFIGLLCVFGEMPAWAFACF